MAQVFFYIIIAFIILNYLLERLLDYLNSTYWSDKLPEDLSDIYDEEKYKSSQNYERENLRVSLLTQTISFIIILVILFFKGFALLDDWLREFTSHSILLALLFFGILGLASDLLSLPFSIYKTFRIEEKYGFNKTTIKTFILDKVKGWLMTLIIGGGLLALIIFIYEWQPTYFWLFAWAAIGIFTIIMTMFYSEWIVPLFNKQKPLEEGELRKDIESFAIQVGFKLKNIYVIDGSKRSTKANAYFSGLGSKKRIVLYDTLIQEHTNEELVAILAHEIGHYKKKHTLSGTVLSLLQMGLMLFILSIFLKNPALSAALGSDHQSFHLGLIAFVLLYSPISTALGIFMNVISRKNEYAADAFAAKYSNGKALQDALKKLSVNHLSNLKPHPAYVFFYYSHPPLLARLKALKEYS